MYKKPNKFYFVSFFSGPGDTRTSSAFSASVPDNKSREEQKEDDLSPNQTHNAVHHVTAGLQEDSLQELEVYYSASTIVPPPVWPPRSLSAGSAPASSSSSSVVSTSARLDHQHQPPKATLFDAEPTFKMRLTQMSQAQANFFDSLPRPPAAAADAHNSPASRRRRQASGSSSTRAAAAAPRRGGSGRSGYSEPVSGRERRQAAARQENSGGGVKRLAKLAPAPVTSLRQNSAYVNNIFLCQELGWAGPPRRESMRPQPPPDHCFKIRHQPLVPVAAAVAGAPNDEESERQHDSIVTSSLLQLTSFAASTASAASSASGIQGEGKRRERVPAARPTRQAARVISSLEIVEESPRSRQSASRRSRDGSSLSSSSTTTSSTATASSAGRKVGGHKNRRTRRSAGGRGQAAGVGSGTLPSSGEKRQRMRRLWEQSGMKTNGRKLLLETDDEEDEARGHENGGFVSDEDEGNDDDSSQVSSSLPPGLAMKKQRLRSCRKLSQRSSSSTVVTTTSYDSIQSAVGPAAGSSARMRQYQAPAPGLHRHRLTEMDTADLAGHTKQVRFIRSADDEASSTRDDNGSRSNRLVYDKVAPTVWVGSRKIYESYYGTVAAGVGGFKNSGLNGAGPHGSSYPRLLSSPSAGSLAGSGFTLLDGGLRGSLLKRRERRRRRLKTCCKALCLFLLLATFLLVIVAVSIFLTKGKNHFGSM